MGFFKLLLLSFSRGLTFELNLQSLTVFPNVLPPIESKQF